MPHTNDIIRMAREAGLYQTEDDAGGELWLCDQQELERFAALVAAAERNKLAGWMMAKGYSTGHGDTVEDLLNELEWQVIDLAQRGFCASLRQIHDSYALASRPPRKRENK